MLFAVTKIYTRSYANQAGSHPSNSLLGGSENHALSIPPFRELLCGIGLNIRKIIAMQG